MTRQYDLVVIGSGTAASVAGYRCRAAGWRVAVIDHLPFGGTCALRGCDPKKVLVGGAEAVDFARRMRCYGVGGQLFIDWKELIAFKRSFTDPVPARREKEFAEQGVAAMHGTARFVGPDTVTVDGGTIQGGNILIATGARPVQLEFLGAEHLITSDMFMELDHLPHRVVMVGGGYIAAEFSHIAVHGGGFGGPHGGGFHGAGGAGFGHRLAGGFHGRGFHRRGFRNREFFGYGFYPYYAYDYGYPCDDYAYGYGYDP